jgi:two-component system sensor histidine kinase/response regulator
MSRPALARILIVDDETDLVTALCRVLEAQGYSTTGAATAAQGLDTLRAAIAVDATKFDVLLTDLTMPDMNGVALLREALAIDADLVGIVMTGHGTIGTAVEAMKNGALDYILKPFNLSVAMPVLTRALAVRRLRLENAALLTQVANRTAQLETSNSQLQIANQDLDAYSSSVSHDLRGHLNRIIGFSQLLSAGKAGPLSAQQKELMDYVRVGGEQLLRLADDLLRFARLGQQSIVKGTVDVTPLVHQIFHELQTASPDRAVELRVGALPPAVADPALFRQVLVNLLSNAFKFTQRVSEPIIEVTGQILAGEATYRVRDNGAGFDMAHAQRLFSSFQRLHTESEFEGTGLGLAIVRRILERHGGTICAEAALGQGAAFTFTLPALAS